MPEKFGAMNKIIRSEAFSSLERFFNVTRESFLYHLTYFDSNDRRTLSAGQP